MKILLVALTTLLFITGCSFDKDKPPQIIEVTKEPEQEQLKSDLFQAVLSNDYNSVENLIKNGAPLEEYDNQGHTVLMRAVQMKNSIMVNILLEGGANVFTPLKDDPTVTAYSKLNPLDTEIVGFFNKKINAISVALRKLLTNQEYAEAFQVIENDHIPFDLKSSQDSVPLSDFIISSIKTNDEDAINLVKFLFDGRDHQKISASDYSKKLLQLTTEIKNAIFFDYITGKLVAANIPHEEYILDADATDTDWLASKLSVLVKYQVQPPLETVEKITLLTLERSVKKNEGSGPYIRLFSQFLSFGYSEHQKNAFTQKNLELLLDQAKSNKAFLVMASSVIQTWSNHQLSATGYSLDVYVVQILSMFQGTEYDYPAINATIRSLLVFTSNRDSLKSIEFISTGQFNSSQENDLIDFVLSYIDKLPKGILALVTKSDTTSILNKLLSSNIPFDQNEQADAISATVESSKSGDTAKTLLLILKEKNIPFNTRHGADALTIALKRLWNNDDTYSPVVDFLLSVSDSPVNILTEEEKISLLRQHTKYVISTKKNWSQLTQLLQKMNSFTTSSVFAQTNYPIGSKLYNLKISFVWDFILMMYEDYKTSPNESDQLFIVLNEILKKFASESVAMGLIEENSIFDPSIFFTQKILPLSLLLWAGKENIDNAIGREPNVPYSLSTYRNTISLDTLSSSDLFVYYSQEKTFWVNIVQSLIANKFKLSKVDNKAFVDLLKIVAYSGGFSRFPSLLQQVETENISLEFADKGCKFQASDFSPKAGEYNYWTTLGTFEALKPLQQKSCQGHLLSMEDTRFALQFILHNMEAAPLTTDIAEITNTVSPKKCNPGELGKPVENPDFPYSRNYTELGTATKKSSKDDSDATAIAIDLLITFDKKCYDYSYIPSIHARAKSLFLRDWMNCAVTNNDNNLVKELQQVDSTYHFAGEVGEIDLCRW